MAEQLRRRSVVFVDDDELTAAGIGHLIENAGDLQLSALVDHAQAIRWTGDWRQVDVVILDASDTRRSDVMPGIEVLAHIRRVTDDSRPPVVAVLSFRYAHLGLKRRAWEAGADFFLEREHVTEADLLRLIRNPDSFRDRRVAPDSSSGDFPRNLGLRDESDMNAILVYMRENGLQTRWARKGTRWTRRDLHQREVLQAMGRVRSVDKDGVDRPTPRNVPDVLQYMRIWEWGARSEW
jgi:CheY-like chemotaxis protein